MPIRAKHSKFYRCAAAQPRQLIATTKLLAKSAAATGAQMRRSHLIGVTRFINRLSALNTTTAQHNFSDNKSQCGNTMPARVHTTAAKDPMTTACTNATIRMASGSCPGNFPARAMPPQGKPPPTPIEKQRQPHQGCKTRLLLRAYSRVLDSYHQKHNNFPLSVTPMLFANI